MINRDLSKLAETNDFQNLINLYNLKFKIDKGSIILTNGYTYIHIYNYITENWIYFTVYWIQKKLYCFDMNSIECDNGEQILDIYKYYKDNHTETIICSDNNSVTLLIEARFLSRIEILKTYCSELLEGKFKKFKKYFEPMPQGYKKIFDEINALFDEKSQ
jgi:hypothetical protein